MPSLVAMTPTVIRVRRSVRREIRATCAWQSIHEAGMGRPSRSIVRSHAVARSCLGAGRLNGMGGMDGVGGMNDVGARTGARIGEPGELTEGMNQVLGTLLGAGETWGAAVGSGSSTIMPR